MTEEDPLRVEVEHRGRRRGVPLVFDVTLDVDGTPLYVHGERVGSLVGVARIKGRLPGGHEITERFLEEMAEDLGPEEDPEP